MPRERKPNPLKCYVHRNTDAVGVCSSCGRGVCRACAIKLRGKIYCKEDAARLFDVRKENLREPGEGKEPRRTPPVIIGAVLAYLLGGIAALISFVLIYAGIIGGGGGTGLFTSLLTPNLSWFGSIQGDSAGELLTVGFVLLFFGSFGIAAGYFFFRPTMGGGVAALAFGLIGLVAAFELSSLSVTTILVDPWFAMSGAIIALSLFYLAQRIRSSK